MKTIGKQNEREGTIIYVSHGGGPLPILGDRSHAAMVEFMQHLPNRIPKPDAIVVVSAHWEEKEATLLAASQPDMLYDYYGFPDAAYEIMYPTPGNPKLASRLKKILEQNDIACRLDHRRGFDHGLFIPLKLMYPQADIPSIQLSLISGLDPAAHLNVGKALRALMSENLLFIGSGFSFHNLSAFSVNETEPEDSANNAFQDWLTETCTAAMTHQERELRLIHWEKAPAARYCHPREEHLLPLHVCVGAAGEKLPAVKIFDRCILGKRAVAFQW